MRRLICMLLTLLFICSPALAEQTPYVQDLAIQPGEEMEIRYYLPTLTEASLALTDEAGAQLYPILSPRTLIGGLHVLKLEPDFFGEPLAEGRYLIRLSIQDAAYTGALTVGDPDAAQAAQAAQAVQTQAVPGSEITPALRSSHRPEHENCYWCTPMDITDEAAVWAMLTAPVTYVDIDQMKQTVIYAQPDENSEAIAVVTGQSQALHVLEELDNGWTMVETYSTSFFNSEVKNWNLFVTGYIQSSLLKTREVNQRCGIVVDKLTQRMYVFLDGKLETTLRVSTGLYNEKQPYNETRSGEFLLVSFTAQIKDGNVIGDYAIRFNAADYVHEVLYNRNADDTKNYKPYEPNLGARASHGCIRVQRRANADGYTMKKLYELLKELTGKKPPYVKFVIWEDYQGRQIPIPADDTVIYYNDNGKGVNYHSTANCYSVDKVHRPLTAFTYGELNTGYYAKLTPCPNCNAPLRAEQIEEINRIHREQSPGQIMELLNK